MRIEKGQLVTRGFTASEVTALRTRAKGKWYGLCQDEYPRSIDIKTFAEDPNVKLGQKRKITVANASSSTTTAQPVDLADGVPVSRESRQEPPAPKKVRKQKASSIAGPSRSRVEPPQIEVRDQIQARDQIDAAQPGDQNPYNNHTDFTDGAVLQDHLIISKQHYEWDQAKLDYLRNELDQARREAARQTSRSQLSEDKELEVLKMRNIQENKDTEAKAAKDEIDRLTTLARRWQDKASEALSALAATETRSKELKVMMDTLEGELEAAKTENTAVDEQLKQAKVDKDTLEGQKGILEAENAALEKEVRDGRTKIGELETKGRRMFDQAWGRS
jgi:hypothetical protein